MHSAWKPNPPGLPGLTWWPVVVSQCIGSQVVGLGNSVFGLSLRFLDSWTRQNWPNQSLVSLSESQTVGVPYWQTNCSLFHLKRHWSYSSWAWDLASLNLSRSRSGHRSLDLTIMVKILVICCCFPCLDIQLITWQLWLWNPMAQSTDNPLVLGQHQLAFSPTHCH